MPKKVKRQARWRGSISSKSPPGALPAPKTAAPSPRECSRFAPPRVVFLAHRWVLDAPRALVIAACWLKAAILQTLFTGGYGPKPLTRAERAAIAARPRSAPLGPRRVSRPWLESELTRAFGDTAEEEMAGFSMRAPVDLRVNRLKADARRDSGALESGWFDCDAIGATCHPLRPGAPAPRSKHVYSNLAPSRFRTRGPDSRRTAPSQTRHAGAGPGGRRGRQVPGAGGGDGEPGRDRCQRYPRRGAGRAGNAVPPRSGRHYHQNHLLAHNRRSARSIWCSWMRPCSGSGTWRRQPELKWRLTAGKAGRAVRSRTGCWRQAGPTFGTAGWSMPPVPSCLAKTRTGWTAFLARNSPVFSALTPRISGLTGCHRHRRFLCRLPHDAK